MVNNAKEFSLKAVFLTMMVRLHIISKNGDDENDREKLIWWLYGDSDND